MICIVKILFRISQAYYFYFFFLGGGIIGDVVVLLRCLFLSSFCVILDMTYLIRYYFTGINESTTLNYEAAPFVTVSLVMLMAVKNN